MGLSEFLMEKKNFDGEIKTFHRVRTWNFLWGYWWEPFIGLLEYFIRISELLNADLLMQLSVGKFVGLSQYFIEFLELLMGLSVEVFFRLSEFLIWLSVENLWGYQTNSWSNQNFWWFSISWEVLGLINGVITTLMRLSKFLAVTKASY